MGPLSPISDPADGFTAEEAQYYDYWDRMQLAYNYDWLDPDTSSAHEDAFFRLAGWGLNEAERLARNEADHQADYEAEP
jgi:hypothetical protein